MPSLQTSETPTLSALLSRTSSAGLHLGSDLWQGFPEGLALFIAVRMSRELGATAFRRWRWGRGVSSFSILIVLGFMARRIRLLDIHCVAQPCEVASVADAAADGKTQQEEFEEVGRLNPRVSKLVGTTLCTTHGRQTPGLIRRYGRSNRTRGRRRSFLDRRSGSCLNVARMGRLFT